MGCYQPLTDAELVALRARIKKLEAQYDALIGGFSVEEFVDQNGEKVRYSKGNLSALASHIADLKRQLDPVGWRRCRPRPVGFLFR